MTWPRNPLEDGDGIGLLNTEVDTAETFLNDIDQDSLSQNCFNLYHSHSLVSLNTPDPAQISTDRTSLFVTGHTYDFATFAADVQWSSHTSDSGWAVVGDVRSGFASPPAQITMVGRIGNGNQTAENSRVAGVLLQGNVELRSWQVGSIQELIVHLAFQYFAGGVWNTIASSNRAWSLVEKTSDAAILLTPSPCQLDLNCTEIFTAPIFEADGFTASSDNFEGFRMVISLSTIGGAALTGCEVELGAWNFSALGLQSGSPQ